MGESMVDASRNDVKIGGMGSSDPAFEVSVSFGRFENVSLSWEKWSSFSPNKYLEEVEKCATPGSVAKKKAYFEEHYKKIAARKAELQAQEKPMERKSMIMNSDNQSYGDLFGISNGQHFVGGDRQDFHLVSKVNEEPETAMECQNPSVEEVKDKTDREVENQYNGKIDSSVKSQKLRKAEETAPDEVDLVKEVETLPKGSQVVKDLPPQNPEKNLETTPKIMGKSAKLSYLAKSPMITPAIKEKTETRIKKKPTSPAVVKTPQFPKPRASKPTATPTSLSASRTSSKAGTSSPYSLSKTKGPSLGQSKKVSPRSLHMSLSLGSPGSESASNATTRKSLIMEKMGDKDIVKRAFKAFQSNYSQLKPSSQEKSASPKKVPAKGREQRLSTLTVLQKENEGLPRVSVMEKKNAKAAPSYFGLKSDEKSESSKESSKKLQEKSKGREAEENYLQTKSKDNRDAEIKKLRQSLNFKATPLPVFYHGQRTSKSPLDKSGNKSDTHR